jgi:hypothetical protein
MTYCHHFPSSIWLLVVLWLRILPIYVDITRVLLSKIEASTSLLWFKRFFVWPFFFLHLADCRVVAKNQANTCGTLQSILLSQPVPPCCSLFPKMALRWMWHLAQILSEETLSKDSPDSPVKVWQWLKGSHSTCGWAWTLNNLSYCKLLLFHS